MLREWHLLELFIAEIYWLLQFGDDHAMVKDVNIQMKEWNHILDTLKANLIKA